MKKFLLFVAVALSPLGVFAQTPSVPASAAISYALPTTATDGTPLTGAQALTKVQLFASNAAIPDGASDVPKMEHAGADIGKPFAYTTSAPNGSTLYFRLKACNVGGCSAFSGQATKPVQVSVPGVPTGVTVTITIVVSAQ